MIVEFSVKNYRSIKDLQTLSFEATDIVSNPEKYPDVDKNNIVEVGDMRLLKTVGIYGANASGKSNVVRAFLDFCKVVGALQQPSGEILKDLAQPFLYKKDTDDTDSYFQIVFMLGGKKYRYGFTLKQTFQPTYVGATTSLEDRIKEHKSANPEVDYVFHKIPDKNASNLTKYYAGINTYQITYEWLYCYENESKIQYFLRKGKEVENDLPDKKPTPDVPHEHTSFLTHAASFGSEICSIIWNFIGNIHKSTKTDTNFLLDSEEGKQQLIDFLAAFGLDYLDIYKVRNIGQPEKVYLKKIPNRDVDLELRMHESEGTQKLYNLAGQLLDILNLQAQSCIIALDEIDSRFHPKLVLKLIEAFNDPEVNKSNAQLLFTSHDISLMHPAVMRRDQFYFTEKNLDEETRLYSLSDLRGILNDANFARQYLAGFYGGVPSLARFVTEPITQNV